MTNGSLNGSFCNRGDYDKAVATRNQLLDAGTSNEKHPLADLVNTLGALIGEYDNVHYSAPVIFTLNMESR